MARARAFVTPALATAAAACALSVTATATAQADGDRGVAVDVPPGDEYDDTDPSALTDFRATLDPHGAWVDDGTYGTAWTPDPNEVGPDFVPYDTAGQWQSVDGDDSWVSDFAWGWVCFHYGRWAWSSGRWLWIPGREYAAAWVDWRIGGDGDVFVGWAPMAPAWIWVGGGAVALGFAPVEPWAFAAAGDFYGPGLASRASVGPAAGSKLSHSRPFVRAQPSVAGPFRPTIMHGPTPAMLGLDPSRVAAAALTASELRAKQLARPSTARLLGARGPAPHFVHLTPRPAASPGAGPRAAPRGSGRGRR
jgi:hypothetical protein